MKIFGSYKVFCCGLQLVTATLMDLPHYSVIRTMAVVCVWWGLEERSAISVLEATLGLLLIVYLVENALITGTEY
jgi:hypothetical protein